MGVALARRPAHSAAAALALLLVLSLGLASCQRVWVTRPAPRVEVSPGVRFGVEPTIRVRIRETVTTAELASGRALFIRTPNAGTVVLHGTVRVSVEGGVVTLSPTGGGGVVSAGELRVTAAEGRPLEIAPTSGSLMIDGVSYPGFVHVVPRSDAGPAAFDLVATIPMELYVAGVIARELYSSWRPATFEAQAVAARSYALHERARAEASGRRFDVESTTRDQVFGGETTLPVAIAAARATRGVVLISEGEILRAYYSSTCGGRAAGATETWASGVGFEFNHAPALRATARPCECSGSGLHRWERTRTVSELSDRLRAWGRTHRGEVARLGGVRTIRAVERNATGRVSVFEIEDVRGRRVRMRAEDFRVASNYPATGTPEITRATRVPSGDAEVEIRGGVVQYRGRGFGHGVGMCQFGAQQMAGAGAGWQAILSRYYPGSETHRVYP